MENMHTDVRVEKVRYLASSNLMNYLVYKFYFQELLCVAWRQQQHTIRPHRSLLFTRRLIQRVNGGLEIVCSKLCYIYGCILKIWLEKILKYQVMRRSCGREGIGTREGVSLPRRLFSFNRQILNDLM